jgi:cobyrinic acid a,c-diamide synthase
MFAGSSSDVGKTTIVLGVMRALTLRGLKVQGYKAGPDYIDTSFHSFATHRPSRNLDPWLMKESTILSLLARHEEKSDVSIMEGVMGMFDGASVTSIEGSSAHLAKITKTPVILIINGKGVALSAAAMVLGFSNFDPEVKIAGVIINQVSNEGHYKLIKEGVEKHTGIPCLGYLKKSQDIHLKSRHLGLVPSVEVESLDLKMNLVAKMVEETLDLDHLLELAKEAKEYEPKFTEAIKPWIRLAVAKDQAFSFYYEDNLDLLKNLGCELVAFSPINDVTLPENIQGLYIGGGFPEVFAHKLEKNKSMREAIKKAIINGLPTYAECGGYMYLSESLVTLEGLSYEMVGIFSQRAEMTDKLQRFGYVSPVLNCETPIGPKGTSFRGHEFHRSKMFGEKSWHESYDIVKEKNKVKEAWTCGSLIYNCIAAYAHVHFYSNTDLAKNFIESCRKYKNRRET